MKKVSAILVALITVFAFALIGWFLYRNYPTTPVLIINLIIIMAGVLLAYTVYKRMLINSKRKYYEYREHDFPEVEDTLIYAVPSDFCNKIDYNKGSIFITGLENTLDNIKLLDAVYDKLLDEVSIKFSNNISITVKGLSTIAVGDNQFSFFGFDNMKFETKNEKIELIWESSHLELFKDGENYTVRMPDGMPTFVFDWSS
ncbi:MAG: AtpZ/AtpI family protein [Brumimicrobium sp.]